MDGHTIDFAPMAHVLRIQLAAAECAGASYNRRTLRG